MLHFNQLVLTAADTMLSGDLHRVDAVAALNALQQVGLAGVGAGINQINTSLVDGYGSSLMRMPMSAMQGSSATSQQSQSTLMFFITLM